MKINHLILSFVASIFAIQCSPQKAQLGSKLKPIIITEKVNFDTDDPAIWINPKDASKSLVVGTDKETEGALFVFDLKGKIVHKVEGLKRPNNVDIQYGFLLNGKKIDIAVTTERENNKVKIYQLPEMKEVGEFSVFEGEAQRDPMGISLYKKPSTNEIFAIVSRKTGPSDNYLWQYQLEEENGKIRAKVVRKFGKYSGKKEIESIVVDQELGYVYYSDETFGIRKYYADYKKGNEELAVFGKNDFKEESEGISIYPTSATQGYILISNQKANTFNVYLRENPEAGRIAEIPVSTLESDGSESSAVNFGSQFPKGIFVAMSNGKVFHIYDYRDILQRIEAQLASPQ